MASKRLAIVDEGCSSPSKRFNAHWLKRDRLHHAQGFICAKSAFFAAACSGRWRESKDGVVKVPTIEPDTLQLYIHWCYANEIDVGLLNHGQQAQHEPDSDEWICFRTQSLMRVYIAADMLLDTKLQDGIMDELFRLSREEALLYKAQQVTDVLRSVGTDSKLYAFMVDHFVNRGVHRKYFEDLARYPQHFLADVVVRMSEVTGKVKTKSQSGSGAGCRYHVCCKRAYGCVL